MNVNPDKVIGYIDQTSSMAFNFAAPIQAKLVAVPTDELGTSLVLRTDKIWPWKR